METIKIHIAYTNEKLTSNNYMDSFLFNYSIIMQNKPYTVFNGYITCIDRFLFIQYCKDRIKLELNDNNINIEVTERNLNL